MLTPEDVTLPGFYWYFDAIGGAPVVVQIEGERRADMLVLFAGRDDVDALADLSGSFIGPLLPPAG
jgi:hypothetical protein